MKTAVVALILSAVSGAFAAGNCKCQDPSGTGPQWDDLTQKACGMQFPGENGACVLNKQYHGDQHHQCSSSFGCIDAGAFNDWCAQNGAPGAYCWS
ncbi:hypothetical protein FALBO_12059 [Fusarium albosuccineum]|uniref:Uncharacterized protein n=1 Tax=Fusarium albosuccineum TaxID=1237068 RepID=A0A8H4L345_9HYPO|nr:hypothetical protein FALBO_12059 [Fusarium albosuccineum]KAF5000107.1 hypothetical protein FDECE_11293 [Fusarium decemcellulare]